jgi:uncharacterized protein (DUF1501 family)
LREVGDSLRAFVDDLTRAGEARRVLVLVFSEFGRRVPSAGNGTDHGAAAPVFLIGPRVSPGLHGPHPNLQDLDNGDLRHAIDFRRIYATILDEWFGSASQTVLGQRFEHVPYSKGHKWRGPADQVRLGKSQRACAGHLQANQVSSVAKTREEWPSVV